MGRKKVLHILRMSEYSGAEKVAISIIKIFRNQYDMIYLATDGTIREKLEEEQVKYVLLEKFTRKNIKRAIKKIHPDIVHAHDFTATLMIAGMKKDFRLISHLHQDPLWARKWNQKTLLFTAFLHRIDCLIVVSENALQNFVFKTYCQKNVKVIHNLIDPNEIYCLANNENGEKVYDLLFCGRFSEPKNPERFVDIVEEVVKDGVNVHAAMLGRGPLFEDCKKRIIEKQLENHIELLGFVNNPYWYMARSKIMCMTSRWEGYGLVAAEANVLGVPVLATRAVGFLKVYGDETYEYCDSDEEFCVKIKELLQDNQLYEHICESSLKRVAHLTDIDCYKKEMEAVYEEEEH